MNSFGMTDSIDEAYSIMCESNEQVDESLSMGAVGAMWMSSESVIGFLAKVAWTAVWPVIQPFIITGVIGIGVVALIAAYSWYQSGKLENMSMEDAVESIDHEELRDYIKGRIEEHGVEEFRKEYEGIKVKNADKIEKAMAADNTGVV